MNKARARFNLVRTDAEADAALVQLTAPMMDAKLEEAREKGRGGWWDRNRASNADLQMLLEDHVAKAHEIGPNRLGEVQRNLIDIANLAAMMAIRIELYGDEA